MLTDEQLAEIEARCSFDCGDNSCRFARARTGQRTNGGCRCLSDLPPVMRAEVDRLIRVDKLALLAEVKRLRRMLDGTTLMGCEQCAECVQPKHAIAGMCGTCAEKEIARLREWQKEAKGLALTIVRGGHGHQIHEAARKLLAEVRE